MSSNEYTRQSGDRRAHCPLAIVRNAHRDLIARIDSLCRCSLQERAAALEDLTQELTAHIAAEEQELYAVLLSIPDAVEGTRRSLVEHRDIAAALDELGEIGLRSRRWGDKVQLLRMRLERHVEREEREVLPFALEALDDDQLRVLAERLSAEQRRRLLGVRAA